jgi:hypothetical protein
MREIKFRVYDLKKKEMITHFNGARIDYALEYWETHKHVSDPMQYTGLKDKNGKEIYECDILKYKTELSIKKEIGKVEWYNGCFVVGKSRDYIYMISDIEVIGNIYETPELLE